MNFDELYKIYPRKEGKRIGKKRFERDIKSEEDYSQLKKAVEVYSLLCRDSDRKYIKHFSTFMNCWEDYVDMEAPLDKASIRQVVCGNKDYSELEEKEKEWIQNHNGRLYLGSLSEWELNKLLGG